MKSKQKETSYDREKLIVRTSIIGIAANFALAAAKAAIGLIANSIAVVLDAVNNLTDALSSVVTIIGTKLGAKAPDRKHPLGYGRIEYISAMTVSFLVLYAGVTALIESVKKIISPEKPDYTAVSLTVIALAVAVKILLGLYVKKTGEKTESTALCASGKDALFDAILSASVLACALVFRFFGIALEAYVGVVIAGFVIRSGVEILLDTLSDILGKRSDPALARRIKELLQEEEEVLGAFDLVINNYGPGKNYASVHLELPDTMTVADVDRLTRKAQSKVYRETGVVLIGVGVYSYNTADDEIAHMRNRIMEIAFAHDHVLQMHGFYVDTDKKELRFDLVLDFSVDHAESIAQIKEEVLTFFPDYSVMIVADVDVSD